MTSMILPWVDAKLMSIFLAHSSAQFPNDHCVMLLDGAGWHKANDLVVPANMTLLSLPPYSPELNPARACLGIYPRERHPEPGAP